MKMKMRMSRLAPAAIIVGILSTVVPFAGEHSASREVRFQTSDGVTIYGDLYMSPDTYKCASVIDLACPVRPKRKVNSTESPDV